MTIRDSLPAAAERIMRIPVRQPDKQRARLDRLMAHALDLEAVVEEHAKMARQLDTARRALRYVVRYGRGEELVQRAQDALEEIGE